eukprot:5462727-Alexandrium_andersonii.AAC.1
MASGRVSLRIVDLLEDRPVSPCESAPGAPRHLPELERQACVRDFAKAAEQAEERDEGRVSIKRRLAAECDAAAERDAAAVAVHQGLLQQSAENPFDAARGAAERDAAAVAAEARRAEDEAWDQAAARAAGEDEELVTLNEASRIVKVVGLSLIHISEPTRLALI